jgi:MFS family permease
VSWRWVWVEAVSIQGMHRLTFSQCFYINLPIGAVAAVVIFFFFVMPESARPAQATKKEKLLQLDLVGAALMMGLIISYILALQYAGQTYPWGSSVVIGLLVGFVALLAVFVAWEILQKERAMIVPRLVSRDPSPWSYFAAC